MPKYFLDRLKKIRPEISDYVQYKRDFCRDKAKDDLDLLVVESWCNNYMRSHNVDFNTAVDEYFRVITQSIIYSDDFNEKFYKFNHKLSNIN